MLLCNATTSYLIDNFNPSSLKLDTLNLVSSLLICFAVLTTLLWFTNMWSMFSIRDFRSSAPPYEFDSTRNQVPYHVIRQAQALKGILSCLI